MGDRTVSIPTPVSNEEAEQGQKEWDNYYAELRRAEYEANGGGCVMTILPFVLVAIGYVGSMLGRAI